MGDVVVLDHPYIQEVLTILRNKYTSQIEFRKSMVKIGRMIGYELTRYMEKQRVEVETPVGKAEGVVIPDKDNILIVNVLRAAIPLVEGLLKAFPKARQGVISAKRIEDSIRGNDHMEFDVRIDYVNIPGISEEDTVVVADPMLATGSTMNVVLDEVVKRGKPKRVIVLSVISTQTGIDKVLNVHPYVDIFTASIDKALNEKGYIVPGLGDAGDRSFNA
jgi:uracil phosphoribosyltransferase